jgi:hypothetical protein
MRANVNARLTLLDHLPKASVGAEIGVHKGDFSHYILGVVRPRQLLLVDPWKHFETEEYSKTWYGDLGPDGQKIMDQRHDAVAARFAKPIAGGVVKIVRMLSADAAETIDDDSLDFVYIDGDHSYEGVSADLAKFHPKVKRGGFLGLDDYSLGNWWADGIVRAAHEFLARHATVVTLCLDNQILIRKL